MKRNNVLMSFAALVAVAVVAGSAYQTVGNVNGPPPGHSGGPAESGTTCVQCHNSYAEQAANGWITSNIPAGGYTPNQIYTVTATATMAGVVRFGFQISPQDANGNAVGMLMITDPAQTQNQGGNYVEHTYNGTNGSGSKTWTFNWMAPPAGNGSFTFYGAFNCANNNGQTSGDHIFTSTLTVNECTATADITSPNTNGQVCSNAVTPLMASSGASYAWSNGATTQTVNVGPGSYQVTVSQGAGCSAVSQPYNLQSLPLPSSSFSVSDTSVCPYLGTIASIDNLNSSYLYTWIFATANANWAFDIYNGLNISWTASGIYPVSLIAMAGCTDTTTHLVHVFSQPLINLTATSDSVCAGNCDTLATNVTNASGGITYMWFPDSGIGIPGATDVVCSNVPGSAAYIVNVTDGNGCTASQSTTVVTNPLPTVVLTQNSHHIYLQDSSNLTVLGWTLNGIPISTLGASFAPTQSGLYAVTAANATGCTNTAQLNFVYTGVHEFFGDEPFALSPNPADDALYLTVPRNAQRVEIINALGQQMPIVLPSMTPQQVDVTLLTPGVYAVRVFLTDGRVRVLRFEKR